jgi:Cu/Ag efflux pump CusA
VPETRTSVAGLRRLLIDGSRGGHVRLGDVADVRVTQTPIAIERDAVSRRLDVVAHVSGRSLSSAASEIEDRLANVSFPLEYHAEVLTETPGEEIDGRQVLAFAIACAIAALLLLQAAFRSWRVALLTLCVLPVALVGGVPAALIAGGDLTLGSLIGFLALFALAARSAVLRQAAAERLSPTVTSATAIAVVMLPFVIAGNEAGLEVVHPMAVVVLGGLVSWTLVSLFLLARVTAPPGEDLLHRWAGVERAPAEAGEREPAV